jgi:LPXTG-motif cell wall-anchored protein
MTQHTNHSPRAFTAIAAVLALSATSTLAQEAVPAATAPVVAEPPASAPAPSIVTSPAPELRSERTMVNEPIVQQVPVIIPPVEEPEVAATPVARAATAPRAAAPRPAARAAAAAPAAAAVTAPLAETNTTLPVANAPVAEVAPIVPQTELAPAPVDTDDGDNTLLFGGLLAALGLGGAFALTRRRKRDVAKPVVFERPVVAAPPMQPATAIAPVTPPVAPPRPMFNFTPAPEIERKLERVAAPAPVLTGAVPHGEERQALLDDMVAAAPDEANPFTSAKGRRKRARIILQSREAAQQNGPATAAAATPRVPMPVREFQPA